MKKTFLAGLFVVIGIFAIGKNIGTHFVSCYKCKEYTKNHSGYADCMGCPAWRRYDLEKGQHEWMIYHCQHGHELRLAYKSDERK